MHGHWVVILLAYEQLVSRCVRSSAAQQPLVCDFIKRYHWKDL